MPLCREIGVPDYVEPDVKKFSRDGKSWFGGDGEWIGDLLLRDANGNKVVDPDGKETLLDIRTADKRTRVAAKIGGIIDSCAAKGFQAIEPDNYDSYSRSKNLISTTQAQDYIKLLSSHAHAKGLAIAQKNRVVDVEYTNSGLSKACASWQGKIGIVQRDEGVVPAGAGGYVRRTC
jgi:hypothetical protein